MINAPVLVLTAAALSAVAQSKTRTGPRAPGQVISFWGTIVIVSGGLLVLDRYAPPVASGLAALWIIGGIIANGDTITEWFNGVAKGLKSK